MARDFNLGDYVGLPYAEAALTDAGLADARLIAQQEAQPVKEVVGRVVGEQGSLRAVDPELPVCQVPVLGSRR